MDAHAFGLVGRLHEGSLLEKTDILNGILTPGANEREFAVALAGAGVVPVLLQIMHEAPMRVLALSALGFISLHSPLTLLERGCVPRLVELLMPINDNARSFWLALRCALLRAWACLSLLAVRVSSLDWCSS
jgi:hypothetical protein